MYSKKRSKKLNNKALSKYKKINKCRICNSKNLKTFLKFGKMPLAGGFIKKKDLLKQKTYPLTVVFCNQCKETQILETIPSRVLFQDYRFVSSTTKTLSNHFIQYAKTMKKRFLNKNSLVVEFGSNDGVLLKPFNNLGVKAIGVEPSKNISKLAKQKGCKVINDFFNLKTAKLIGKNHGKASLICANNVFAHIDNMHEPMKGIKFLLKNDGVFVFEVHYLVDLLEQFQFDMIYHEHMMHHSLTSLSYLLNLFDMEIFDVLRIPIHSGSIRVYAQNKNKKKRLVKKIVKKLHKFEIDKKVNHFENLKEFGLNTFRKRNSLVKLIRKLKSQGKRIVGYGASGRATVHINFCKFNNKIIDYVVDASHERQGRFIPGMNIPIISPKKFKMDNPDYAILFAYNYFDEVVKKERDFIKRGGKFILPLPIPKIVK
jgi:SAM-dependent methyltransferase